MAEPATSFISASSLKPLWKKLTTIFGGRLHFSQPIGNDAKIDLVWIPAGSFRKGVLDPDEIQPLVTLTRGFWMGKYPVTQRQYEALVGENPSHFKNSDSQAPVEQVDWHQAQAFCQRLNERLSQTTSEDGPHEFRLPTNAEWEYACRAGSETWFSFGDDEYKLGGYAWFEENSGGKTHAVGQKKPNAWGLYDMHGNVWEWCQDWSGDVPSGPVTDPTGAKTGQRRLLCGGSWDSGGEACGSTSCDSVPPSWRYFNVGFRVVLAPRSVPPEIVG